MKALPKSVKVGPVVYDVKIAPRLAADGAYGAFARPEALIEIHPDMAMSMQEITLWHELVHIILVHGGIRVHEEVVIDALAHGIVGVLQDNPDLTK